ncbi:TonB-dependent receptor [Novosphingobium resinovorum]|uniref:Outer membrane receptor protein n=1 Tax=Novosphingobium resinovorum TaxID=158500 RepID=A0A031J5L7_9SPHN|nr:TonB-dependent receptor [Novosphingobium resinovorum]AOR81057.1 TonB-dependent receptor [Novosphingobium resinovorum]EZP68577.1 Outer membrane receptor protein precursor [Novosphingobium resinovorum]
MKGMTSHFVALMAATALTAISAGTALAQSGTGGGDQSDIIVTARRVEERLQDVPISITVFNQQQLANRNVINGQDLAAFTPSLATDSRFGSQNAAFAIRGFVRANGTQPSVGVYFADVVAPRGAANSLPIGDGAGPGAFFDLQNVQVLKGPQGTLFGRNTTGGAIVLVPQKPTGEFGGYVEVSVGNYDLRRLQAVLNLPLGDSARLRIGGDRQTRDGYLKNGSGIGPGRFNDVDYTSLRASLVVDLTPDLENYLIGSYSRSDTNGDIQKLVRCGAFGLGPLGCLQLAQEDARGAGFFTAQNSMRDPRTLATTWQLIDTTTWRASDALTVKNIVSYAELRQLFRNPLFGTAFDASVLAPGFIAPGTIIDFASSRPIPGRNSSEQSTFTEELQLQGSAFANRLTYQGGAYLEVSDPLGLSGSQAPVLLSCADPDALVCANPLGQGATNYSSTRTRFRNVGLYGQATYSLSDRFKLTGGLRYTWDKVSNQTALISYLFPAGISQSGPIGSFCTNPDLQAPNCENDLRQKSSAPTWLIGLDYKPDNDVLLYAKYVRGYRTGGVNPTAPTGFGTFDAEKVDTYEAGIKTSFRGPVRGTFDVSAFYNGFANQQLELGLTAKPGRPVAPTGAIINAGQSRIYGAEAEISISPFAGFTADVSYAYLNTKILRVADIQTPASSPYNVTATVQTGDPLQFAPKNKVAVTGTYVLPLPDSIGKVSVGATYVHTDRQTVNYSIHTTAALGLDVGSIDPTDLLSLNLAWNEIAGKPVDLNLFMTNATNSKYYRGYAGLYTSAGFEVASIGEPRMYGARLKVRFGR